MLQHHRGHVQRRQHVAEAGRQVFLLLEVAAERQHRHVRRKGELRAELVDVLVIAACRAGVRRIREPRESRGHHERACGVRQRVADVAEQRLVEIAQAPALVLLLGRVHFPEHVRMAADRALAQDHEAAREDVRTLDRDRDRHDLVTATEIILRAEADALAAVHVHRVVRDLPCKLRAVVLQHRSGHGRLLTAVDRACRHRTRRVDDVRSARHARERGLDALELADRLVELLADARIRSGRENACLGTTRRIRRQRDAAAHGQLLDQHAPTLAGHLRSADDAVERHEHVLAPDNGPF